MSDRLDDDEIDELERCAEAATEDGIDGWSSSTHTSAVCSEMGDLKIAETVGYWHMTKEWGRPNSNEIATHIATADPPTVLALVEEVRRLREVMETVDE